MQHFFCFLSRSLIRLHTHHWEWKWVWTGNLRWLDEATVIFFIIEGHQLGLGDAGALNRLWDQSNLLEGRHSMCLAIMCSATRAVGHLDLKHDMILSSYHLLARGTPQISYFGGSGRGETYIVFAFRVWCNLQHWNRGAETINVGRKLASKLSVILIRWNAGHRGWPILEFARG